MANVARPTTAVGAAIVRVTRTINTTYPLQGGGDLSEDRTLSLDMNDVATRGVDFGLNNIFVNENNFKGLVQFNAPARVHDTLQISGETVFYATQGAIKREGAGHIDDFVYFGNVGSYIAGDNKTDSATGEHWNLVGSGALMGAVTITNAGLNGNFDGELYSTVPNIFTNTTQVSGTLLSYAPLYGNGVVLGANRYLTSGESSALNFSDLEPDPTGSFTPGEGVYVDSRKLTQTRFLPHQDGTVYEYTISGGNLSTDEGYRITLWGATTSGLSAAGTGQDCDFDMNWGSTRIFYTEVQEDAFRFETVILANGATNSQIAMTHGAGYQTATDDFNPASGIQEDANTYASMIAQHRFVAEDSTTDTLLLVSGGSTDRLGMDFNSGVVERLRSGTTEAVRVVDHDSSVVKWITADDGGTMKRAYTYGVPANQLGTNYGLRFTWQGNSKKKGGGGNLGHFLHMKYGDAFVASGNIGTSTGSNLRDAAYTVNAYLFGKEDAQDQISYVEATLLSNDNLTCSGQAVRTGGAGNKWVSIITDLKQDSTTGQNYTLDFGITGSLPAYELRKEVAIMELLTDGSPNGNILKLSDATITTASGNFEQTLMSYEVPANLLNPGALRWHLLYDFSKLTADGGANEIGMVVRYGKDYLFSGEVTANYGDTDFNKRWAGKIGGLIQRHDDDSHHAFTEWCYIGGAGFDYTQSGLGATPNYRGTTQTLHEIDPAVANTLTVNVRPFTFDWDFRSRHAFAEFVRESDGFYAPSGGLYGQDAIYWNNYKHVFSDRTLVSVSGLMRWGSSGGTRITPTADMQVSGGLIAYDNIAGNGTLDLLSRSNLGGGLHITDITAGTPSVLADLPIFGDAIAGNRRLVTSGEVARPKDWAAYTTTAPVLPNVTTAQRDGFIDLKIGQICYNTETSGVQAYVEPGVWVRLNN
jgi:hypothetical protein